MTRVTKVVFAAVLFAITSAQAALPPPEPKPQPDFELGLLAGIGFNFPSLGTNYSAYSVSAQAGFAGGGFLAYHLSPALSLELNLIYAFQAYSTTQTISTLTLATNISKDVLEMPVLLRYWVIPHLGIAAGPYGAFGIGNYTVSGVSYDYSNYSKNRAEFGVAGSLQGRLPVGSEAQLLLDVRYLLGLTNLNTDGAAGDSLVDHQLEILAGISFSL